MQVALAERPSLYGYGLGISADDVRVIANDLFNRQRGLRAEAAMNPAGFAQELRTFSATDQDAILLEFRSQGGDPIFISKVESILAGKRSPLRSPVLLAVGTGVAGLILGVIVGRVTKG